MGKNSCGVSLYNPSKEKILVADEYARYIRFYRANKIDIFRDDNCSSVIGLYNSGEKETFTRCERPRCIGLDSPSQGSR
jgi:hypothetical protein